jgi:hypothetical protein
MSAAVSECDDLSILRPIENHREIADAARQRRSRDISAKTDNVPVVDYERGAKLF